LVKIGKRCFRGGARIPERSRESGNGEMLLKKNLDTHEEEGGKEQAAQSLGWVAAGRFQS